MKSELKPLELHKPVEQNYNFKTLQSYIYYVEQKYI